MRYCQKCGHEVKDDANYCPMCGSPVYDSEEGYGSSNSQKAQNLCSMNSQQIQQQNNSKGIGIALIIFMFYGIIMTIPQFFIANPDALMSVAKGEPLSRVDYVSMLIPFLWKIPMTIFAIWSVKKKKRFHTAVGILTLIFCNLISRILMFLYKPEEHVDF